MERTRKANEASFRLEWVLYCAMKLGACMMGHTDISLALLSLLKGLLWGRQHISGEHVRRWLIVK